MSDNILLYLTPKSKVAFIETDATLRQVMEKLDHHRYSAIPILTPDGKYFGTITEGDILRKIKSDNLKSLIEAENVPLLLIKRAHDCAPIKSSATLSSLLTTAIDQNFIPVLDDNDHFIGIITRKAIILNALKDKFEKTEN